MKIKDLETLIDAYYFSTKNDSLNLLFTELDKMTEIPFKKMELIKSHPDYQRNNYLSNIEIKKVRKVLLDIDMDLIKEFNEKLKPIYNHKWIHFIHDKSNWLNQILKIIKNSSKGRYGSIENRAGYDNYEKRRLEFDYRIVSDGDLYSYNYTLPNYDSKDDDPDWSEKISCICIKDVRLDNSNPLKIFTKGEKYSYRKKINGQINVYPNKWSFIFEGESFYEYFLSPDSRDRQIDIILGL